MQILLLMHQSASLVFGLKPGFVSYIFFPHMQLKKEIKELTLQLDLAQSQVKDLLRLVGDNGPTIVLVCLLYTQASIHLCLPFCP